MAHTTFDTFFYLNNIITQLINLNFVFVFFEAPCDVHPGAVKKISRVRFIYFKTSIPSNSSASNNVSI